jgi:hypothetical protein
MSEITEDEAVAALQWAQDEMGEYRGSGVAARALLGRVRWLCAHEWLEVYGDESHQPIRTLCAECGSRIGNRDHDRGCSVGVWTRAAKRVGLC